MKTLTVSCGTCRHPQMVPVSHIADLRIHDHVIIGNGTDAWVSLAASGLL